jgi:transcriptional regulator GlxA family with amidase domain
MKDRRIGLILFNGAEELDFVGPFEVFTMINAVIKGAGINNEVEVILVSETGADIKGAKGMRIGIDYSFETCPPLDVICIPGGFATRDEINNPVIIDWIKKTAPGCEWVTSVCTGAFLLAKAGLTVGKKLTTHWFAFDEFEENGLPGELQTQMRYVRDGNLVTAAGVSAGIDMALWLTGQMYNPDLAGRVQKAMEYDPAPPYSADV